MYVCTHVCMYGGALAVFGNAVGGESMWHFPPRAPPAGVLAIGPAIGPSTK